MKTFQSLIFLAFGGIGVSTFGNAASPSTKQQTEQEKPNDQQNTSTTTNGEAKNKIGESDDKNPSQVKNMITVGVKGMVCAFCANGIEKSFLAQPEVDSVVVSLENKFLKLTFKPGKSLSNEKISTILKDAGYEANFGG